MSDAAPAATDILLAEDRGPVRILTLNRPRKLNALSGALVAALTEALHAADADREVVALVLTGAGRAFCAGADTSGFRPLSKETRGEAIRHSTASVTLLGLLSSIDKPVIAATKGYALGAGASLALGSDMVVAGESTRFGYPELKLGVAASHVGAHLAHLAGPKAAFELLTLCEQIGPARAEALGLVNRVVPDDRIVEEAVAIGTAMAAFDRDALWQTKRTFHRARALPLEPALAMSRDVSVMMSRLPG